MHTHERIHLLSDAVKHMIAAGEVVEGSFSVIKELVENSLDAESRSIDIEVEDSGFKKISVRDDGTGIWHDDLPLAIREHATSKIRSIEDISIISSYGFRGEALSSIAAVSNLTILSRRSDEKIGGRLEVRDTKISVSDYAGPSGTTVIVENIFYNTPARKKFLKSIQAEARAIRETVTKLSIPRHETSFTLILNGKKVLSLDACASPAERIEQLFGMDEMSGLTHETLRDISVSVEGFVSRPHFMKATRSSQFLYVNKRHVELKHLGFLLSRAYESSAPQGKYPAAFIFIEIKPDLVDVNIHPAKREIKFFDQRYIEGLIVGLVKKTLSGKEQSIGLDQLVAEYPTAGSITGKSESVTAPLYKSRGDSFSVREVQNELSFAGRNISAHNQISDAIQSPENISVIGLVFGTYILAQKEEELKIIDFHAAHERFNYDIVLNAENSPDTQALIFPEVIELSKNDYTRFLELVEDLNARGFDAEPFSESSIIVRSVPSMIKDSSVKEFFKDLIDTFGSDADRLDHREHIIASRIACHASRRANDCLSYSEMQTIADKSLSGKYLLTCPHGRPYVYSVKRSDFEKLFRR
jgi:DNA mismatch repair protein MutL